MKKVSTAFSLAVLFTFIVNAAAFGQLLNENFNYPAGDSLNVLHGWTVQPTASYVNTVKVASPGLTYPGYASSGIGNSAQVDTTGQDIYRSFTGQTSGSVYAAFLANVTKATTTGDYFFHFAEAGTTTFRGRVYTKLNGADIQFGLLKGSVGTVAYTATSYPLNTTHLIVMKYVFNTGTTTDDSVYLWINPTIGGPESAPDLSFGSTDVDFTTLSAVNLRQGTAANAPRTFVDGIRVGTSWDVAVNGVTPPPSGVKTIPGDYATIAAAVADLNTLGVGAGGVTFNVAGGYTESVTSPLLVTATGTSGNPIVFQKSGGANPVVTRTDAGSLVTSTLGGQGDAVIILQGSDYVTFNSIDVAASDQGIEYGYFLRKANATDGCKNVTIRNATVTMTKGTSQYVVGIYSSNLDSASLVSSATGITVTSTDGRNENVTMKGNTISNVFTGILLRGYAASTPYDFYDQNFVVGADSGGANTIQNVAGNAVSTAYGIYLIYHNNVNVNFNSINNTAGGGTGATSTFYGIFFSTGTTSGFTANSNNINITTSATSSSMYGINNAATGNLAINNNFITLNATASTSGLFGYIYNSSASASTTIAINNNTIIGTTYTTTGNTYLIYNNTSQLTPGVTTVSGNSVSGALNRAGASGTLYCYYNNGSPTGTENIFNDNFSGITLAGTSTFYGILSTTGSSHTHNVYNNVVSNNTGGTGTMYGIHLTLATRTVYNNSVFGLAGGGTVWGISNGSGNASIYKNKIYNLSSTSTGTTAGTVTGIYISASTNTYIYNNFISDLRAATSAATDAVRGIGSVSTSTSSTIGLYYNSIFLNASSTGANFGTSGIFHTTSATATTAALDMRNNVVVNNSTPAGTGLTAAYRRSTTALTNYASTSNNNDLYAGTPGASNVIFTDGTNSDQTIADFKTRVGPRESSSFTESAPFVNVATTPYDLHMNTTVATQTESGGTPVTAPLAIASDYDGDARNVSSPDVGADEFAGMALDLSSPSIVYTPLSNTGATTARTLTATITDASGVPTAGIGLPVLYWGINSGSYSSATATSLGSNQYEFTLGSGVATGDTVKYYIAAQDAATTPNVGVSPSAGASGFTPNPPAASTPPTSPSSYRITQPALSGDYTVGVSAFNSAAGTNLHLEKFTRRVMKEVEEIEETKPSDVKQDQSAQVMRAIPARTVLKEVDEEFWALVENGKVYEGPQIFHPVQNSSNSYLAVYATITAAVTDLNDRGVSGPTRFLLIDTAYTEAGAMTIAISNAAQPTSTNTITFKPSSGVVTVVRTTSTSPVFIISSPFVIIDGSNTASGTTRDMTLANLGTAASSGVAFVTSRGVTIKNIIGMANTPTQGYAVVYSGAIAGRVENCSLMKATIGFQAQSASDSIAVVNNDIGGSSVDGTHIQNLGVSMLSTTNYIVSGNRIIGLSKPSSASVSGILAGWQGTGFPAPSPGIISNNIIRNVKMTGFNGAAYAAYGINLSSSDAASNIVVVNNMISDIFSESDGSTSGISFSPHGIYITQGGGYKIYYNSVNLFGNLTDPDASAVKSGALTIAAGAGVGNLDIRNNVLSNSQTMAVPGATKKSYAVYSDVANTAFTNINYADYYSTGPDAAFGFLGSDRLDLAAWRIATAQDVNSVSGNPRYRDSTNLHIDSTQSPIVSNAGTSIAGVTTDIDGQTRDASTPDIGADEFSLPTGPGLSGSYTVGAGGNFPTLDSAFSALQTQGVIGAVTLNLTDTAYVASDRPTAQSAMSTLRHRGAVVDPLDSQFANNQGGKEEFLDGAMNTMTGALTLSGPITGASATNRITIKPATNTAVTITSTGIWGINLLNASFVTIDGVSLTGPTRLTINAPSATTGALLIEGNSDNNIVQNTTIRSSLTAAEGIYLVADSATATPDNNKVQNNAVLRALDGIVIVGNATSFPTGNWITNNQIGSATDSIGEAGIYVQQAFNTVIDGNYIRNIRQAGTTFNLAGIWVATKHLNTQISNNVIRNVKVGPTTTAAVFAAGLYIFGTATDTTSGNYFNNMIYDLDYLGTVTGGTVRGIYASAGIRDTIAYNSVYLTGTAATNVTSGGLYTSTHVNQVLQNNVVINTRTEMGTGRAMAFYKLSTTSTIISNYNDLYVPTQALSYVGAVSTTNYATLVNWQATGRDSQSVSVMANFRSPDLHIDSTIATPINGGATPIAGIAADFDGQARNASTPDIGADEFFQPPAGALLFEQFESGVFPPAGWSSYVVAGDSAWHSSTTAPFSGTTHAYNRYNTAGTLGSKFLVTKRVNIPSAANTYELSFWMRRLYTSAFPPDTVYVKVSTTDSLPASFTQTIYKCYTGALADTATDPNVYSLDYRKFKTTITGISGPLFFAFDHQDNDGQTIYLDDVTLQQSQATHDIGVQAVASASAAAARPSGGMETARGAVDEKELSEAALESRRASLELIPVPQSFSSTSAISYKARVRNFGQFVENSYQVGWTIDGAAQSAVNNTHPLQIGGLDTLMLTWATPTPGQHVLRAFTVLASDANHSNDTATFNFSVAGPDVVFEEGFNGTIPPYPTGWHVKNLDGGGTSTWFQGNPAVFPAFEGSGYIGANYLAANGFFIDEWLVTPNTGGLLNSPNAAVDSLIFWQRAPGVPFYPDSIQIRVSTTDTAVASFTTVLDFFRVDTIGWRRKAYALPNGANRYIAFRYLIYDGGPSGNNSNYVGIDGVQIKRTNVAILAEARAEHVTSAFRTTVTNEGTIGSLNAFVGTGPGSGFQFNPVTAAGQRMFGDGIMIALDSTRVSDAVRTNASDGSYDADFKFLTLLDSVTTGTRTAITSSFTDSLAETPFGARINQRSVSWDSAGINNFLILELDIVNTSGTAWTTLHAGGLIDWDVDPATANDRGSVVVDSTNTIPGVNGGNPFAFDMLEMHQGATPNSWMGIVPLNENRLHGRRIAISSTEIYPTAHVTNGDKWRYMTSNRPTNPNGDAGSAVDHAQVFGSGPYSVAAGATKRVGFALFGGTSLADAVAAARAAQRAWVQRLGNTINVTVTGVQDPTAGLPEVFELAQNYPNPFNPTTTIKYALPEAAHVTLGIYNVLGQRIAELTNEVESAGFYSTLWNGRNQSGSQVATGVYFYRIEATPASGGAPFVSLKKMVLLK